MSDDGGYVFGSVSTQLSGLNWLLLIEVRRPWSSGHSYLHQLSTVVIVSLFFYFYLNRITGVILSYAIRLYSWHALNARFEIQSIQIAPLGGRISFKDVRYYSRNQSLRVLKGHVTWRYWLWRVRDDELGAKQPGNIVRPCRVSVELEGVEWFLYNRTPSYDALLKALGLVHAERDASRDKPESFQRADKSSIRMDTIAGRPEGRPKIDWLREMLPIQIHANAGAIILGNRSTPTLLIVGFHEVEGTYAVVAARSEFDLYKQVFHFTFAHPRAIFRTNPDYVSPMRDHGAQVLEQLKSKPRVGLRTDQARLTRDSEIAASLQPNVDPTGWASFPAFLRLLQSTKLERFVAKFKPTLERKRWEGLARYKPEVDVEGTAHLGEYAKVATFLECPELELEYYADSAGPAPHESRRARNVSALEGADIGNGDLSPEWGVDVKIKGGVVNYGPWTDRQRAALQGLFTPPTYFDSQETAQLEPGDERVHTALKIFIEFSAKTVVRIPTRESSKDWKFDGESTGASTHRTLRPYGWIDLELGSNSYLSFLLPMVSSVHGFDTQLELHLDQVAIQSSVNSSTFIRAQSCRVHCLMPSPLKWDARREWHFRVALAKADIFLLRDHTTLIADVVKDMLSGPPGDYAHFVPYTYSFNVSLTDYNLHVYLNSRNIINNPDEMDDNALLIFKGPRLEALVVAPSELYMQAVSLVEFSLTADRVSTVMSVPNWHTHAAFLTDDTRTFGTIESLRFDGSYVFYDAVRPNNVETLRLAIDARGLAFKSLVWVTQYLVNLRDNYFGTTTHFVTLEEVRALGGKATGDPIEESYRRGSKDVFEVNLVLQIHDAIVAMPQEIYDCKKGVLLYIPEIQLKLRNHDYFMDMAVQIDPIDMRASVLAA